MDIKLSHGTYEDCSIEIQTYLNLRPALVIYHEGQVLLKASVNMPDHVIPEGYVCIKDWAENEGILASLIEYNIIDPPEFIIQSGFVYVNVCKLLIGENHEEKTNSRMVQTIS